ncbi:MAG: hypothetical protein V1495_08820 [Pseudomonadota bacterium]
MSIRKTSVVCSILILSLAGCYLPEDDEHGAWGETSGGYGGGVCGSSYSGRSLTTAPDAGSVTYNQIFSAVDNATIEGEGFFVDFGNGTEIFVSSHFTDNPHDISNVQRKFQAILKGVNKVTYPTPQSLEVFVESKAVLGSENRVLTVDEYEALARQVRELGHKKTIQLVYYKDLTFEFDTVRFSCAKITEIASTTETTGGSVYLFTVSFSDGTDPLSVVAGTSESNSLGLLAGIQSQIEGCKGSNRSIVATGLQFQEQIYTCDGTRSGWTTFHTEVRVE